MKQRRVEIILLIVEADALQTDEDGINVITPSTETVNYTDVTSNTPFSQFDTKLELYSMIQSMRICSDLRLTRSSERIPQSGFLWLSLLSRNCSCPDRNRGTLRFQA